ncbi:hypothetical protein BYT27DRAFT_7007716, partial [Phlegmacium glaucopus]
FMNDTRWVESFLPTLTHMLFISPHAFQDFRSESLAFVETVQDVFDVTYPNIEYTFKRKDAFVLQAASRLNSKKSKIASSVFDEVAKFFQQSEYKNNPAKIMQYCTWAFKTDGPAFNAEPTPLTCAVPKGHPQYIKPRGLLCSDFIFPVAVKFMRQVANSAEKPRINEENPPVALYALILLAV